MRFRKALPKPGGASRPNLRTPPTYHKNVLLSQFLTRNNPTTESKFQRQQRITAEKNREDATRIMRVVVDDYCMEFNSSRWAHSCRGRNLCGLRAYARAAWACMVQEDFVEEDEDLIEVVRV